MRFGSGLNDLFGFFTGAYACTMPAAIPTDASVGLIERCVAGMERLAVRTRS